MFAAAATCSDFSLPALGCRQPALKKKPNEYAARPDRKFLRPSSRAPFFFPRGPHNGGGGDGDGSLADCDFAKEFRSGGIAAKPRLCYYQLR